MGGGSEGSLGDLERVLVLRLSRRLRESRNGHKHSFNAGGILNQPQEKNTYKALASHGRCQSLQKTSLIHETETAKSLEATEEKNVHCAMRG